MNILSQIFGILAIIVFGISPHQKTKKKVLIVQLLANILYAIQYTLLYAFSAVVTNIIGGIKNYIYYYYEKKENKIPIKVLVIYIIIILIFGIFTFNGIYSLIPIFVSVLYGYGTWQNNLKSYRIINIVGSILWIIYNCIVGAYVGVIGNVFQLTSTIIAIIRLDIIKDKNSI